MKLSLPPKKKQETPTKNPSAKRRKERGDETQFTTKKK
jgi:hypothetical protein